MYEVVVERWRGEVLDLHMNACDGGHLLALLISLVCTEFTKFN